ncbi:MAG: ECF transporter S component [Acidimicrobiales bacterium]|nr:ECF transporter S component [Acidimicrobiales bacterium]
MTSPTATTSTTSTTAPRSAVQVTWRSWLVLGIVSVTGLCMFLWPLVLNPGEGASHRTDAPFVFVLVLPLLLAVVLAELASGGMDAKALAMLGVLAAMGAALRPFGAGTAGIETTFFLLVLAGRVYGPGFGFVLGNVTLFASALVTGGVGPWLPFQMLGSGWVGLGAGLLPAKQLRGRLELVLLATYGAVAAYLYGFLLNLWFWPFAAGAGEPGSLTFVPGDAVGSNLRRFFAYTVATSTWGWDTGRAITNIVAVAVLGPTVLLTLRRAARKAAWDAPVTFLEAGSRKPVSGD